MAYLDGMAQTPNEPAAILDALTKQGARIRRLEAQLRAARAERMRLVHDGYAIPDGVGGRVLSRSKLAAASGITTQAVDQILAKARPEEDK